MDLASLEQNKALAVDAMLSGQLDDADAMLENMEPEYLRHGENDGLFALRFNRLLIALERDDQHTATALMAQLADALDRRNPLEPGIADVTARIKALFRRPISGIDYQLTEALTLLCDRSNGTAQRLRSTKIESLVGLPKPVQLLTLDVTVWAPLLFDLSERTRTAGDRPRWLRALHGAFASEDGALMRLTEVVNEYRSARADGDRLKAYRRSVEALALAVDQAPSLAGRLLLTIEAMEGEGLPKKLAFAPNSPQEARYESTISFLGRLAEALAPFRETAALAERVWEELLSPVEAWCDQVRQRGERGARRAGDTEKWAGIALWQSRALQHLGDFEGAESALDPSLTLAVRRAIGGGPSLGGRVLYDAGLLSESKGNVAQTHQRYLDALNLVMPGLTHGQDVSTISRAVDTGVDVAGRCSLAARIMAGLGRLARDDVDAAKQFELARAVLAFAMTSMGHDEYANTLLWVELSAAVRGFDGAALRALEAAHATENLAGQSLALYFASLDMLRSDSESRQLGLARAVEAAALAREGGRGALRTAMELGVAKLYEEFGDATDEARLEIHLRRSAESLEKQQKASGQGELDVFLEPVEDLLAALVERLIEKERFPLVRRLVAAYRGWGCRANHYQRHSDDNDSINARFRNVLELWWQNEAPSVPEVWPKAPSSATYQWPRTSIKRDEACLEYTRIGEHIVAVIACLGETFAWSWHLSEDALKGLRDGVRAGMDDAIQEVSKNLIIPIKERLTSATRLFVSIDPKVDGLRLLDSGGPDALQSTFELGLFQSLPNPLWEQASSHAPHRLKIVGDRATAVDLKLSMLTARSGLTSVEVVHGDAVLDAGWNHALIGGRHLHLVGSFDANGGITLIEKQSPVMPAELAEYCTNAGTVLLCIAEAMTRRCIELHLPTITAGVRGGVLIKRWPCDSQREFLLLFLEEAWHAEDPRELAAALKRAELRASNEGMPPAEWQGYQLYLAVQPS